MAVIPFNIDLADKRELEKKYIEKSNFKSFHIIDGNQIKTWLESNIEHAIWFLSVFGSEIGEHRIRSVESEWERLLSSTKPKLNSTFFLLGYDREKNEFLEKLKSDDNFISSVSCNCYGAKYAYYFAMSVIMDSRMLSIINNSIVVDDYPALEIVETYCKNKIILVNFNYAQEKQIFLINNHYIFFDESIIDNIKLGIKKKDDIKLSLKDLVDFNQQADYICSLCGYNPISIIRYISTNPREKVPLWTLEKNKFNLIPLAILGSINFDKTLDNNIVDCVVKDKDKFINELNSWTEFLDPPVRKNGTKFNINSKSEYFNFVHVDFFLNVISLFENKIIDIIHEKSALNYSDRETDFIVNSIIESFIIISTKNKYNDNHFVQFSYKIYDIIYKDKSKFDFFAPCLKNLAELSPNAFLNRLIDDNKKRDEILVKVLNKDNSNYCNFVGLSFLNALESILSIKQFAIEGLKALLEIYYSLCSSKIVLESLAKVLTPFSSVVGLIALKPIDKLNVFFNFASGKDLTKTSNLISCIKNHSEVFTYDNSYNTIKFIRESLIVTYEDVWNANDILACWTINNLPNPNKIIDDFINCSHRTPIDRLANQISNIKGYLKSTKLDSLEREAIKIKILKQRESILKFDNWKYLTPFVKVYNEFLLLLKTDDYFEDNKYILYNDNFPLLNPNSNYHTREIEIKKREKIQSETIGNLIKKYGQDVIVRVIKECPQDVYTLWNAIKCYITDDNYLEIINILIVKKFSCGLRNCLNSIGTKKILELFEKYKDEEIFIKNLPYNSDIFRIIDGIKNESLYWENNFYQNPDSSIMEQSYTKYLKYDPFKLVNYYAYDADPNLEVGLEILKSIKLFGKITSSYDIYSIRQMVDKLDNNFYDERLSIVEIGILNYMIDDLSDYPLGVKKYFWNYPEQLGKLLADLNASRKSLIEHSVARKMFLDAKYAICDSCYIPKDYVLKYKNNLLNWCKKVVSIGVDKDESTKELLNSAVVNILSCCPIDPSLDIWPIIEVADVLEYLSKENSDTKISSKFYCCYMNRRGVRTIGDGSPEIECSNKFRVYADKYSTTHLTTLKALYYIADGYKNESEQNKEMMIDERY